MPRGGASGPRSRDRSLLNTIILLRLRVEELEGVVL